MGIARDKIREVLQQTSLIKSQQCESDFSRKRQQLPIIMHTQPNKTSPSDSTLHFTFSQETIATTRSPPLTPIILESNY